MADELFTLPPSPDELEEARERESQGRERATRLHQANAAWQSVPPLFRRPVVELLPHVEGVIARELRESSTIAAVLIGPTGCGKTTGAAILVRLALSAYVDSGGQRFPQAVDLVWTTAIEIAMAERRFPLGDGVPPIVTRASTCGLLVLDDLGLEALEGAVFPILAARYDRCKPTIVTSGLTKAGLTKHLGAAGVRRLNEQHVPDMAVLRVDCHPRSEGGKGPGSK